MHATPINTENTKDANVTIYTPNPSPIEPSFIVTHETTVTIKVTSPTKTMRTPIARSCSRYRTSISSPLYDPLHLTSSFGRSSLIQVLLLSHNSGLSKYRFNCAFHGPSFRDELL